MGSLKKNEIVGLLLSLPICLGSLSWSPLLCGQPVFLDHHGSGWLPEWESCNLGSLIFTCPSFSLQVDLQNGLSEFSVMQRRLVHGWNEFVADNTEPVWKKYLDQVGPWPSFCALTSVALGVRKGAAVHCVTVD